MYNDKQAEQCIVEACQTLTKMQIPLNSVTVPDTAIAILAKEINYDDASERIYNQINTMILNGKLKLSKSQMQTWDLFNND
jgi:hypothetical protein